MRLFPRKLKTAKKPKAVRRLSKRLAKMARRKAREEAAAINAYNVPRWEDLMMRDIYHSMMLNRLTAEYRSRLLERFADGSVIRIAAPAAFVSYNGPELL